MGFSDAPPVSTPAPNVTPGSTTPASPTSALYSKMASSGLYTKSESDFNTQFSTPEAQTALYQKLSASKLYTKDQASFQSQFFPKTEGGIMSRIWNAIKPEPLEEYPAYKEQLAAKREAIATASAAKLAALTGNKTAAAIEAESLAPKTKDTIPNDIISGILQASGVKAKVGSGSTPYTLEETGNLETDTKNHLTAQAAYKKAQDLIAKSGYTLDPATGEYKAGEALVPLPELRSEYTKVVTDLSKTFDDEVKKSKELSRQTHLNAVESNPDRFALPNILGSMYNLYKSIKIGDMTTADPMDSDMKRLGEMERTKQELIAAGNSLATQEALTPAVKVAQAAYLKDKVDLTNPKDIEEAHQSIGSSTKALQEQMKTIQTDPNWFTNQVASGIDQTKAVEDHANKDAKNQLATKSMDKLDQEGFYLGAVSPYKGFLESNIHNSEKQLTSLDKQINDLIHVTKGTQLSKKGEEYLTTLQGLRGTLNDNLVAQRGVLSAVNDNIKANSKTYIANEAQKAFMDGDYEKGHWAYAAKDELNFILKQPRDLYEMSSKLVDYEKGTAYKDAEFFQRSRDYQPKALQDADAAAFKYDMTSPGSKLDFWNRSSFNSLGLFHTSIQQGIISAELGAIAYGTAGLGAAAATAALGESAVALSWAAATGSTAARATLLGGQILNGAVDTGVGFIIPSVLLFGNQSVKTEMQNGRSAEDAIKIGGWRAAIEGLTERINPFEMKLLEGKIFSGEVKDLGKDVVFKNLLLKNGLSKRAFDVLYTGAQFGKGALKMANMEALEEDAGLVINDLYSRYIQNEDPTYVNQQPFNLDNLVNTHLLTMATMAYQGVTAGGAEAYNGLQSVKSSRYLVAAQPDLYKSIIADRLVKGLITKDQAIEAIDRVDALNAVYIDPVIKTKIDAVMASDASHDDKQNRVIALFNANYEFQNHAKEVANLPEADKVSTLMTINEHLQQVLKDEKWKSQDIEGDKEVAKSYNSLEQERAAIKNLDAQFSAEAINNTTLLNGIPGRSTGITEHLQNAKRELASLEARREEDQPFNFMEKLKTIIGNLETRKRTLEQKGTSKVSETNPQLLESDIAAPEFGPQPAGTTPAGPAFDPILGPAVAPVTTPEEPATDPDLIQSTDPNQYNLVVAPMPSTTPVVAEEEKPEPIKHEEKLRELHAEYKAANPKGRSFEVWLNTKAGKAAKQSLEPVEAVTPKQEEVKQAEEVVAMAPVLTESNDLTDDDINTINQTSVSNLGHISQDENGDNLREDGGVIMDDENRMVNVVQALATQTRWFEESPTLVNTTNTLNPKFDPILDPAGLIDKETGKGATLTAKLSTSTEYVEKAKAELRENKEDLIENALPQDKEALALEIEEDLRHDSNFVQIDVYAPDNNQSIGNIHSLGYVKEKRVIPVVINLKGEIVIEDNLVQNYRQMKAFRAKVLAAMGNTGQTALQVVAKGNGYPFTEKDNKSQPIGDAIKDKKVLGTIQISKVETGLTVGERVTINETTPGGTYIIIPTGRGDLFAWQVNPKKATKEIVDSYMAAIEFFEKITQLTDASARNKLLDFQAENFGNFDLTTMEGLAEYLNNLIPSSSKTSDFTSNFANLDDRTHNTKFIDINVVDKKITFSTNRHVSLEFRNAPTTNLAHDMFTGAGIHEYTIGKATKEIRDLLKEHLTQRRVATNVVSFKDHANSTFVLPLIKSNNGNFSALKDSDSKQKYKNYKEYLRENTTTHLLEHTTSTGAHAYFQQPTVRFALKEEVPPVPVTTTVVDKSKIKAERYRNSPANRMLKVQKDSENTDLTQDEVDLIEKTIEKAKEVGWDANRLFRQLSSMGFTYALGNHPEAYRNYLEDRLLGKTKIKVTSDFNFFGQLDKELEEPDVDTTPDTTPDVTETDEVPESIAFYNKLKAAKTYSEALALVKAAPAYPGIQASIDAVLAKLKKTATHEELKAEFESTWETDNNILSKMRSFNNKSKFKQETAKGTADHDYLRKLAADKGYTLVRDRSVTDKMGYKLMDPSGKEVTRLRSFPAKLLEVREGKIDIHGRLMGVEDARPFMENFEYDKNGEHADWGLSNKQLASAVKWLNMGRLDKPVVQHMLSRIAEWLDAGGVRMVNSHETSVPIENFTAYTEGVKKIEAEVAAMTDEEIESSPELATFDALTEEEKQQIYDQYESTADLETEGYDYEEEGAIEEPVIEQKEEPTVPELVITPAVAEVVAKIEEITGETVPKEEVQAIQATQEVAEEDTPESVLAALLGLTEEIEEPVPSEVSILPSDKIIFGHPGIGKTFLHEQGREDIIDFDSVYKPRINKELGLPEGPAGHKARTEWRASHEDEWNQKIRDLWAEAKVDAEKSGKTLMASDMILLKEFSADFDKVITMSKSTFIERAKQRNDYTAGSTEGWKDNLDKVISTVEPSKLIHTDKYLSDLLKDLETTQKAIEAAELTEEEYATVAEVAALNGEADPITFLHNAVVAESAKSKTKFKGSKELLSKFKSIVQKVMKQLLFLAVVVNLYMGQVSFMVPTSVPADLTRIELPAEIKDESDLVKETYKVVSQKYANESVVILDKEAGKVFITDSTGKIIHEGPAVFGVNSEKDTLDKNMDITSYGSLDQAKQRVTPAGEYTLDKHVDTEYGGGSLFYLRGTTRGKTKPMTNAFHAIVQSPERLAALASSTPADNGVTYGCISISKENMLKFSPQMSQRSHMVIIPKTPGRTLYKKYLEYEKTHAISYADWLASIHPEDKEVPVAKAPVKAPVKAPTQTGTELAALAAAALLTKRKESLKSSENKLSLPTEEEVEKKKSDCNG